MSPIPEEKLERALRHALGRQDPPRGFEDRVLRRVQEKKAWWKFPAFWSGLKASPVAGWAVVAVLCILSGGGYKAYRREQRRAGEDAKRQVMMALRITGAKLRHAESRIQKIHREDQD